MTTENELQKLTEDIEKYESDLRTETGDSRRTTASLLCYRYRERGKLYQKQGNLEQAIADFGKATKHGEQAGGDEYDKFALAEIYAWLSFVQWQNDNMLAGLSFWRALKNCDDKVMHHVLFMEVQKENPQNLFANVLDALCNPNLPDELLPTIKANPKAARKIYLTLSTKFKYFKILKVIRSIAAFEENSNSISTPGWSETEMSQEDLEGYHLFLTQLAKKHFIGWVCLADYYAHTGEILKSVQIYDKIPTLFPGMKLSWELQIQEAMKDAPKAIEGHLEKKEIHMAAILAKRSGDFWRAAELYRQLAEGMEKRVEGIKEAARLDYAPDNPLEEGTIYQEPSDSASAGFYQEAAECFEKIGNQEFATQCEQNSRRLRKQSELQATFDVPENFILGEWDAVNITFTNNGFGIARKISAKVEGPFTSHATGEIQEVAVGDKQSVEIAIRPNEAGRRVPMTIQVSYEDGTGAHQLPPVTKLIAVTRP